MNALRSLKPKSEEQARIDVERAERIGQQALDRIDTTPNKKLNDEIGAYMVPFRRFPTLKKQEDYERLFDKFRNGTEIEQQRARDLIVYGNVRLVLSVALRYTGRGLSLVDLMQEGYFGLQRAVEKYEIERGFRFSTYAHKWIRQAMTRALYDRNERNPYRIPVHYEEALYKVRKICEELYLEKGYWPKALQVYERLKEMQAANLTKRSFTLEDVVLFMHAVASGKGTVRLDASNPGFDNDEPLVESFSAGPPRTETVVEARRLYVEYQKAIERITAAVDQLPPRTAMVIRLRLGLGDFDAMTLEEVGTRYDVTRERIRQIEVAGMQELETKLGITATEIKEIVDVIQDLEVVANVY